MDVSLFHPRAICKQDQRLAGKKYKKAVYSVSSQTENYPDSLKELFTLQNIADLTVIGYKVFTFRFREFKISGDATKQIHPSTCERQNEPGTKMKCSGFVTNLEKSPLV